MTHNDMIIITVTLSLAIPLGVIASIKLIKQYTRPPVNTLVRQGDIELNNIDYIVPSRPGHTYQPIDLENTHYIDLEHVSNWRDRIPSYFTGQQAPSYYSGGNPPSFNTVDRYYIHNNLENSINLDSILWLFLIFIFIILIWKILIRINSLYVQYLIIRLISICIILFIFLLFKSGPIFISTALILPLSIDKITFAEDLDKPFVLDSKIELTKLYLWNFLEVKEFLESLDDNNYFVLMYFLPTDGDIDVPQQYLSKPFLINKYSSETTITCFINERLNYMVDTFYLDKSIFYPSKNEIGPFVILEYNKIKLL